MCSERNYGVPDSARPKASDVPTLDLLRFIEQVNDEQMARYGWTHELRDADNSHGDAGMWNQGMCCTWHFPDRAFGVPWKVLAAKLDRLTRKGYIDGCNCGCRGDWQLTPKGREMLNRKPLDCPECPGTMREHYPDCGIGADERNER